MYSLTLTVSTHGRWTMYDEREAPYEWTAVFPALSVPIMPKPVSSDCSIPMRMTDFLLYIQHITLCEQYVRVTSCGTGDLMLYASGEVVSMKITNGVVPVVQPVYTVSCTFKYLRAMVEMLQYHDEVTLCLCSNQYLYLEVPSLSIWIYHRT